MRRDGIRFQGLRYVHPTLAAFVGEAVTIRYDPRDLSEIRLFHHERLPLPRGERGARRRGGDAQGHPGGAAGASAVLARGHQRARGAGRRFPASTAQTEPQAEARNPPVTGLSQAAPLRGGRAVTDGERAGAFIVTKEHRRFTEFADAVRQHRYIGLCFGAAGVGKTLSARRYANWDVAEPAARDWPRAIRPRARLRGLARTRTVFYTPTVWPVPRPARRTSTTTHAGGRLHRRAPPRDVLGRRVIHASPWSNCSSSTRPSGSRCPRSSTRDLFDRTGIGVILIGMPGMEKRLSRYPQLYSRVGFAHHYRPLQGDELTFVLTRHWRQARPGP